MLRSRIRALFVSALLAAFTGLVTADAQSSSKISPDLAAGSTSGNVQVIIQYNNAPSTIDTGLLGLLGGVVKLVLGSINALVTSVPYHSLTSLAANSNVKYISLDRALAAHQETTGIPSAAYTTEPINAPAVWQLGYQGTNVGVAVIDSGITPVPDLNANDLEAAKAQVAGTARSMGVTVG